MAIFKLYNDQIIVKVKFGGGSGGFFRNTRLKGILVLLQTIMSLTEGVSLDRNKWLLIAGPAIIKRLARDVFLMLKDSPDYIGLEFGNEADDFHLDMTAWTLKRINFPYFSDTLYPEDLCCLSK